MLKPAILYENELHQRLADIMFDESYMYYIDASYRDKLVIDTSTWNRHQFVSVNANNEVIGYLKYNIDREILACSSFQIINFEKDSLSRTFGKDLIQLIEDIFFKFKFNKLKFCVIIGNPAEAMYDKYIQRIGGRVVGFNKQESKLIDGQLYDIKYYEVMRDDFINAYKKP